MHTQKKVIITPQLKFIGNQIKTIRCTPNKKK